MRNPESILITGSSSGIGHALANYYAAPEVTLFLIGRDKSRLEDVAQECRNKGSRAVIYQCNVRDKKAMEELIQDADATKSLDLVIANAGISGGTAGKDALESGQQIEKIFDINVQGVFNTLNPCLEFMLKRQKGQIAIMSSLAGFRGFPGAPAYCASKAAIRVYGEALRGTLRHQGIEINVICPGFVDSPMTQANDFTMPFMISAEKAARIIGKGLARNKGRISFPFPTAFLAWISMNLPDGLAQRVLTQMPEKKPL